MTKMTNFTQLLHSQFKVFVLVVSDLHACMLALFQGTDGEVDNTKSVHIGILTVIKD